MGLENENNVNISNNKEVVVVSLGADVFAPPGSAIVGGQAVFAKTLVEQLGPEIPTTLVTLAFKGLSSRNCPSRSPYSIIEIPLPGEEYDAFSLWESYSTIEKICREKLRSVSSNDSVFITVYWLSGKFILNHPELSSQKWFHSYASFASQKAQEVELNSKGKYLQERATTERAIANEASFLWTTCQYEITLICDHFGIPKEKCILLPRAVDTNLFYPRERNFEDLEWDILYFGRLDPRKGIYDIPTILAHLQSNRPYRIGVLGGTSEESSRYHRWFQTNALDILRKHHIQFIPAVEHENVPGYLTRAALVIVPSHYETFGNVVLEAHACGVPVVATTVGGIPELVRDGINGYLFSPDDFSYAAKCLDRILKDSNHWMHICESLKEGIPSRFTWSHLHSKIKGIL